MGKIRINNLKYYTFNGALSEERQLGQPIEVDIEMTLALDEAGKNDDLNQTVNYAEINDLIAHHVTTHCYHLIEALAHHIMDEIEENYQDKLDHLKIKVRKYAVPMVGIFDNVEVELERDIK